MNSSSNLVWHREVVSKIVQILAMKYDVRAPFNLPEQTRDGALYQPDIVAFDRESKELCYIIEVQTSNVRKSIAGAMILTEISVAQLHQRKKPNLLFVVKDDSEEHELKKLRRRIAMIRDSLKRALH